MYDQGLQRTQNVDLCPICKNKTMRIYPNKGDYACSVCGYVSPFPYIDETSEYRQFALEHGVKDRSRSSYANDEVGGGELFTTAQYDGTDKTKRMQQQNMQIYRSENPNIMTIKRHVRNIRGICEQLNLEKSIKEEASKKIKEAIDLEITKKKKIEAVDAAAVFLTCKQNGNAKSMEDILQATENVTKREMDKAIHLLSELFQDGPGWETGVKNYKSSLNMSKEMVEACIEFGQYLRENGIFESKKHSTVIAGIIAYMMNKYQGPDKKTIEEISSVVGPKPDSIRSTMDDLSIYQPALDEKPKYNVFINKK